MSFSGMSFSGEPAKLMSLSGVPFSGMSFSGRLMNGAIVASVAELLIRPSSTAWPSVLG